jgi:hypothetical protein
MPRAAPDFLGILRILDAHEVQSIVVGGVCATLRGAPVATFDLDVVHARDEENVDRLLGALSDLDAYYRLRGTQIIWPQQHQLLGVGHHLLMTNLGPLDLLGAIGCGHDFVSLLPHCTRIDVGGIEVNLLSLEMLIQTKRETGRDRDRAVLPILERTLKEHRG